MIDFADEDYMSYFDIRERIHEDFYIKCSQPPMANSFPTLQGITSYILDSCLDISEIDDVKVYITLGVEAMKRGEILSRVKRMLMNYIEKNYIDNYKDSIPGEEYLAMKEDLEAFRLFPPDALKEIPDFK